MHRVRAQFWNGGLHQDAIEALCQHVDKPLVFPLSNPTDKAEITAEHAYEWSHGQAIFASGAPQNLRAGHTDPARYPGRVHTSDRVHASPYMGPPHAPGPALQLVHGTLMHC